MLIGLSMQLITVHSSTALKRFCTLPSRQAVQDCSQQEQQLVISTCVQHCIEEALHPAFQAGCAGLLTAAAAAGDLHLHLL